LPLWFRRKRSKQDEQAPTEAAAPAPPEPTRTFDPPAPEPGLSEVKPKRRRGSRGGRGRRKTPTAEAGEAKREEPSSEQAPRRSPERKPEQRRDRSSRRRAPARRPPLPPAKRELLVSVDVGEQRVAVLEDDRVAEVYLERPERRSIAGNIYKGTVDNVLPGMEAAFVEIGLEKNGFLYVDEIVGPELEGKRHGRKIQDLLSRGQEILVQAVKDPMKSKGARLTTEISLPGRFVVFVPNGEGLGVSRRLEDSERVRLRDVVKTIAPKKGGVIVRTAAEGASAEDVERDLVFLQRVWKSIQAHADAVAGPALVYQEAELPLRVVRDLFTDDFARALVDHDRTYRRIVGYLKKTSPHMVERVSRYRDKPRLFEAEGVEAEINSTLSRRVELPSGGSLVFDYAEAFTVIDVNTGRFTGSRGKGSGSNLEDTITKNNLEAVKEVVRQLRLRDIGGIIVIDFIDMANPKNRALVEGALQKELERDRTKTYVVEISPLGLVEMTRQNVTDGPREILTKRCPTCDGDGIVVSEASAAIEVERRLRALATGSRAQGFRVEVNARVASLLIGPGAARLTELETQTRRRFFLQPREDVDLDHFAVAVQGKLADISPTSALKDGEAVALKLTEVGLHDVTAGVGKLDGYEVIVGGAAKLVGKKVKARVERALDGQAYATLLSPVIGARESAPPVTAESEAEKPTRAPRTKKAEEQAGEVAPAEVTEPPAGEEEVAPELEPQLDTEGGAELEPDKPKRKTRRGSRGGRGRKRKTTEASGGEAAVGAQPQDADRGTPRAVEDGVPPTAPRIHLPEADLGGGAERKLAAAQAAEPERNGSSGEGPLDGQPGDGEDAPKPKRKTRRGSRGGRNRRRKPAAAEASADGGKASDGSGAPVSEPAGVQAAE